MDIYSLYITYDYLFAIYYNYSIANLFIKKENVYISFPFFYFFAYFLFFFLSILFVFLAFLRELRKGAGLEP